MPEINNIQKLPDLIKNYQKQDHRLIVALETGENRQLNDVLANLKEDNICFVIGPEGGFTPEEITIIKEVNDIDCFTLGNHVLRAETAAISAASRIVGHYMEKDPLFY